MSSNTVHIRLLIVGLAGSLRQGRMSCRSRSKEIHADSGYDKRDKVVLKRRRIKAKIDINSRNTLKLKRGKPYRHMRSCVERFFA